MTSVYNYKGLADFRQFIRNITDKSRTMSDVLAGFREISFLPKRLGQLTVEEVTMKMELIEEICNALLKMPPQTKYKLPYNKNERQQEIIDNMADVYQIDRKKTFCKIITGYHKNDKSSQQFPFVVEIAMGQRKDVGVEKAGHVTFIGSVNDTPAVDGGEKYFQSDQYAYRWADRNGEHVVNSAREVLAASGFDATSIYTSRKRKASVVYINVKTDVPEWLGAAGKTHMNQMPYAETIAKTLASMSHNIPSYRGQGFALDPTSTSSTNWKTATDYVDEFLIQRRKDVEANPDIRRKDRLTQRGVAYRLRPKMMEDGFEPRKNWGTTMDTMTNMISARCKELWSDESVDREYLGIYAKARGMFYYRGRTTPIDFDAIEELASDAAINIVIEKEGVPAVLEPYADKYRVALISTQGRFAEYVKDFVASVIDEEAIVVTILDDDKVGHEMAESTDAINIGVGKDTVSWLQQNGYPDLTLEKVQEQYSPDGGYSREYRIEIDSILAEVGAEGLWKFIMYKIEELAPLDLRKSIEMPSNEILYPKEIADFLSFLNEYTEQITEYTRNEIDDDLSNSTKLYEAATKENEIEGDLSNEVAEDEGIKRIIPKIIELLKELKDSI